MCAKTAGHSLPGGEGTAGCKGVNLNSLLCSHNVERADGSGAGGNVLWNNMSKSEQDAYIKRAEEISE